MALYFILTCAAQVSPTEVYLVVNAGCREKDLAHIGKHLDKFTVSGVLHCKHTALLFTEHSPLKLKLFTPPYPTGIHLTS